MFFWRGFPSGRRLRIPASGYESRKENVNLTVVARGRAVRKEEEKLKKKEKRGAVKIEAFGGSVRIDSRSSGEAASFVPSASKATFPGRISALAKQKE